MNATDVPELSRLDFAPNCIWTFTVPHHQRLNVELERLIADERRETPESRQCAGREMWQSQRQVTDDPPVRELFRSIFQAAESIADFLRWDVAGQRPTVQVCWANAHPPGGFHTRHVHPATVQLSGCYYIATPPDSGRIVFHDLARFLGLWGAAPRTLENNRFNQSQVAIEPYPGLCVLFPAYVMHEVETNHSDGDRLGIAFNINFE